LFHGSLLNSLSPEFTSTFTVNDATYEVYTEDKGEKSKEVASTIYLKGRIVHSKKYNYSHFTGLKNFDDKLITYMEKQHKSTIQEFLSSVRKDQDKKIKIRILRRSAGTSQKQ
jgi:major membrane immunogen (membrane-anchored lipoprotein)